MILHARRSALVGLALSATGCRACDGADAHELDRAAIGAVASVDAAELAPYLAFARAVVARSPAPAAPPPPHAGQRVFVTAWTPGKPPVSATGLGATLLDSVREASDEVARSAGADARLEIDVITSVERAALDDEMRDTVFDVGLHGYLASDGPAAVGWVLPSEILDEHIVDVNSKSDRTLRLHGDRVISLVASRAHVDLTAVSRLRVARFAIAASLEGAKPGEAIALYRTMPIHPTELGAPELVDAVRAGADYLARTIDDQGKLMYRYDPVGDAPENGYGMIRHAGAIYALMEAYEELHVAEWQPRAARAVAFLKARFKSTPDGSYLQENADEEQQKVGGSGLALIAMVKYAEATGDRSDLETMRALARFIVHQQYADGHYRENADVVREDETARGKKLKKEVFYYTGEATLGLVRLYAIDPQEQWLAAARKGADYVVHVRDAHEDLKHQIHDHWLSYALHDLYVLTRDQAYAEHAFKIARAILLGEKVAAYAPYPDYAGSFYDLGETTPTSTRLEALASTLQLSRFMGADEAWLRAPAMRLACFMRGQQLDAESAYFTRNPARAIGGVRESLMSSTVQIDYPQHAMSAWLRFAKLLRDPEWGKAAK